MAPIRRRSLRPDGCGAPLRPLLRDKVLPWIVLWRHRTDLYMLAASSLYFLACTYVVCLGNSYADRVGTNNHAPPSEKYTAPDVLVDLLRPVYNANSWMKDLGNILVFVSVGIGLGYCVLQRELSCLFVRRYQLIAGTIYALRAPFVCVTVLPSPAFDCVANPYPNIFLDAVMLVMQVRVACADVFFSGHTILFTTTMFTYCYFAPAWLSVPVVFFSIFGMFSLILTTLHYTIDPMGGFLFTAGMWVLYHWGYRLEGLRDTWWGRVVAFWEADGPPGAGRWKLGKPVRRSDAEAGVPSTATDLQLVPLGQGASRQEVSVDPGPAWSPTSASGDTNPKTPLAGPAAKWPDGAAADAMEPRAARPLDLAPLAGGVAAC